MGTKRQPNARITDRGFPPTMVDVVMSQMDRPALPKFLEDRYRKGCDDSMGLVFNVLWKEFMDAETYSIESEETKPDDVVIAGKYPSSAMDKHTVVGKRAEAYFWKAAPPVSEAMMDQFEDEETARKAMSRFIFFADGAVLWPTMEWDGGAISKWCYDQKFKSMGLTWEQGVFLTSVVTEWLPTLHKARERVFR